MIERPGRLAKVRAFGQLGKVRLVEIWLGPVLAWSLLDADRLRSARSAVLTLSFVGVVAFGMWATHALDDLTGYADGSDRVNYAPERRRSQRKPLVLGTLSVAQARWFAALSAAAAVGCLAVFSAVAGFRPWWVFAAGVGVVLLGIQYSAGINFSYRLVGGGEALTGVLLAATVVLPYAAMTGRVDPGAWVAGGLFGCWLVQVLICSNSSDADTDRAVGRRTVAATLATRANRVFVAGVFLAGWAVAVAGLLAGALSRWTALGLLPAWLLQGYVLRAGLRGRWRNRRNYGFLAVRYGVLGFVIANVLS